MANQVKTAVKNISLERLKQKMDLRERFSLVEALSRESYEQAHLPGALNLPADQVRKLAATILPDKDAEIVVYCNSPT